MQLNLDRALLTSDMGWDKETSTLSEEASTLKFHGGYRLYDDACDFGVWVKSHRTGKIAPFVPMMPGHVERDPDGDVQAWRFYYRDGLAPPVFLIIFND